jgi:Ciliary basal body-associated, B9 protein
VLHWQVRDAEVARPYDDSAASLAVGELLVAEPGWQERISGPHEVALEPSEVTMFTYTDRDVPACHRHSAAVLLEEHSGNAAKAFYIVAAVGCESQSRKPIFHEQLLCTVVYTTTGKVLISPAFSGRQPAVSEQSFPSDYSLLTEAHGARLSAYKFRVSTSRIFEYIIENTADLSGDPENCENWARSQITLDSKKAAEHKRAAGLLTASTLHQRHGTHFAIEISSAEHFEAGSTLIAAYRVTLPSGWQICSDSLAAGVWHLSGTDELELTGTTHMARTGIAKADSLTQHNGSIRQILERAAALLLAALLTAALCSSSSLLLIVLCPVCLHICKSTNSQHQQRTVAHFSHPIDVQVFTDESFMAHSTARLTISIYLCHKASGIHRLQGQGSVSLPHEVGEHTLCIRTTDVCRPIHITSRDYFLGGTAGVDDSNGGSRIRHAAAQRGAGQVLARVRILHSAAAAAPAASSAVAASYGQ